MMYERSLFKAFNLKAAVLQSLLTCFEGQSAVNFNTQKCSVFSEVMQ